MLMFTKKEERKGGKGSGLHVRCLLQHSLSICYVCNTRVGGKPNLRQTESLTLQKIQSAGGKHRTNS